LHGAFFETVPPFPPTSFPDGHFSAIMGLSVMTHLSREVQQLWIAELHRICTAGAIVALTTHGEVAAKMQGYSDRLLREGIIDDIHDHSLKDVAPLGYYRATFQSRDYTFSEWTKGFEIVEHIPGAIAGYQDLVLMRKI